MAIDKALYKDKRLTESEKKKIKPANQGGGPNYLGKQETVTVPKKWLSDPDHVVAELAYITPREQKILLDANLYGSLKGKPNKGPGGIMSLQGDLGGFSTSTGGKSGDSSGKGGGGSTSYKDTNYYEMMTGQKNIGQTVKTGPKTRRYAVPEYGNVIQPDGSYKRTYIGSGYKSYGTPSFFGNLFSRGAPGYRGIKGMPPLGNSNANLELRDGPLGMGYYSDKENFAEIRNEVPLGIMGIIGNILSKFKKPPVDYSDMSKYNRLGLFGVDPTLTDNYSDMKISNTSFSPNINVSPGMDLAAARRAMTQPTTYTNTPFEGARTVDIYRGVDPYKMNYLNRDLPTSYRSESLLDEQPQVPSAAPEDYDFFSNAMADAETDNRTLLEKLLNPDLDVDEALDKEEQKRKREQELLQEIMQS